MRVGTWNVGSMTGRGMEFVDVMKRRRLNILCVQETKWKGNRLRELGDYNILYHGTERKRNGVGVILTEAMKESAIEVKRVNG